MTPVGITQKAATAIEDGKKQGDEHGLFVVAGKFIIGFGKNDLWARVVFCRGTDQGFGHHHEQRCRNALARHIADDKTETVFVQGEEVIEVTAYLFGSQQGGIQLDPALRTRQSEVMRQHALLNDAGGFE